MNIPINMLDTYLLYGIQIVNTVRAQNQREIQLTQQNDIPPFFKSLSIHFQNVLDTKKNSRKCQTSRRLFLVAFCF